MEERCTEPRRLNSEKLHVLESRYQSLVLSEFKLVSNERKRSNL